MADSKVFRDAATMLKRASEDLKWAAHFLNHGGHADDVSVQSHLKNAQHNINAAVARFEHDIISSIRTPTR